jgi:hypothetical protein
MCVQQISTYVSSSEFTSTFSVEFIVRFRVSCFSQLITVKADVLLSVWSRMGL